MFTISGLYRHPIKGFTPEPLQAATLVEDGFFPFDRLYALEVGPSGFMAEDPQFLSKMKFAVLARFAAVARLKTRYDEIAETFRIEDEDGTVEVFDLTQAAARASLARHVENLLAAHEDYDPVRFPLKLLETRADHHRFTDSAKGFVSLLNLNSLKDLGAKIGRDLDPLRLRANVWMKGLPPFVDHDWVGKTIKLGDDGPELEVLKPIVRCLATHVNPNTAERDVDLVAALFEHYGHRDCGIYCRVIRGGTVRVDDIGRVM